MVRLSSYRINCKCYKPRQHKINNIGEKSQQAEEEKEMVVSVHVLCL